MAEKVRHLSDLHYLFRIPIQVVSNSSSPSRLQLDLRQYFNFKNNNQIKHYEACINILQDTDAALINAFKFQLCDMSSQSRSYEDMYLRLYGILDTAFMQYGAYKRLRYLLKHPEMKDTENQFDRLDLIQLRHKAGAHSMDYNDKGNHRETRDSYRLVQHYLTARGERICLVDSNENWEEYNLMDCLVEFEKYTRDVLINLLEHLRINVIRSVKDRLWLENYLKEMCEELIDYSTLDQNTRFWHNLIKNFKKEI